MDSHYHGVPRTDDRAKHRRIVRRNVSAATQRHHYAVHNLAIVALPKASREGAGEAMKRWLALAPLALIMALTTGCATRIGPGHVGIQVSLAGSNRGVQDYTTTTGWVFYNPFSSQLVEYPTYVQTYVWTKGNSEGDESFTFQTKEGMVMNLDVNLSYQLHTDKIPAFYVKFRNDDITQFTFGYLHNVTRDCFTRTGGRYSIDDLMGNNAPFVTDVQKCVTASVADIGVEIQNFGIIGAPRAPQQIIDAINNKMEAQQIAMQKQNQVAQAQADAQKAVAEAEGQAKSKIAIAQGEAEANKKLVESLSPALLQWRQLNITEQAVNKWNGQQPQVLGGGNNGLLFNIPTGK
jgi:regulator of protease activity HflC (stomatin/prohibitin superfamily)